MPCPTCYHTMEACTITISHCPRCGTMVMDHDVYIPRLVDRCRQFEEVILPKNNMTPMAADWRRLGIAESINIPANRPV
jgi:hypothetical protein